MKAWKMPCQNQVRNLQNQKVRTKLSPQFQQVRQNRATPLIRGAIVEASADGVAVEGDVAMAGTVEQIEAETAARIVVAIEEAIELLSHVSRAQSSLWRRVRRKSMG